MSHDPLGASGRKHRRRRKLGLEATCIGCGESDPTVLIQANRTLLEQHHVLGKQHVPNLTVTICRNHHALLSAAQLDDGVPLDSQPTVLERLVAIFHAFASFLGSLAEILIEWAMKGHNFIAGLDADYAGWRTKPWAI